VATSLLLAGDAGKERTALEQVRGHTLGAMPWTDGRHTIFGEVAEGLGVLEEIGKAGSPVGKPREDVAIEKLWIEETTTENTDYTEKGRESTTENTDYTERGKEREATTKSTKDAKRDGERPGFCFVCFVVYRRTGPGVTYPYECDSSQTT